MSGKAEIQVINNFRVKKEKAAFRCIMIYQHLETGFCFIRPLISKMDMEISMELFKIFTSYGAPAELHVNSCSLQMVENMESQMKVLCPMFNINFTKINTDNNTIATMVVKKLQKWMEETQKEEWEIGCCVVQREINTEVSNGSLLSPHEMFFKELLKRKSSAQQTEDHYRSVDVTSLQHNAKDDSRSEDSSKNVLNNFSNTVQVKEEVDREELNSHKDRMLVCNGGVLFPVSKKETVEVKMEILQE